MKKTVLSSCVKVCQEGSGYFNGRGIRPLKENELMAYTQQPEKVNISFWFVIVFAPKYENS